MFGESVRGLRRVSVTKRSSEPEHSSWNALNPNLNMTFIHVSCRNCNPGPTPSKRNVENVAVSASLLAALPLAQRMPICV